MKQLIPMDDFGIFADTKDTIRVDSRFVAQIFHKDHSKVLRDIRGLDCSDNFRQSNFGLSSYKNEQGKKQPCYQMTRDGFTFLVMGYRGKKAAEFKEAYIARFNAMESLIQDLVAARMECPMLTENISALHDGEPKAHHFKNEFDMINLIALGMTAKKFRETHGVPAGQSIRKYLTSKEISDVLALQRVDVGLLLAMPEYQDRKRILTNYKINTLDRKALDA